MFAVEVKNNLFRDFLLVLVCVMMTFVVSARADVWPNKPIKWIVPFPASGGTDAVARSLAHVLSLQLKQAVIVDNKAGANGLIGADAVAHSPPDGYTFLMTIASHAIAPNLYKQLPYDTEKDFMAVSLIAKYPYLLTTNSAFPADDLKTFVEYVKRHPEEVSYASSGNGSGPHLGMVLLMQQLGLNMVHIPYKGAGPANNDLVGGQVQVMLNNLMAASGLIQSKKIKVLAVTTQNRSSALPTVPSLAESGLDHFEVVGWYGVFAPAKTPTGVVNRMAMAINGALKDQDLQSRLSKDGAIAVGSSASEFDQFFKTDFARWREIGSKLHLTQE